MNNVTAIDEDRRVDPLLREVLSSDFLLTEWSKMSYRARLLIGDAILDAKGEAHAWRNEAFDLRNQLEDLKSATTKENDYDGHRCGNFDNYLGEHEAQASQRPSREHWPPHQESERVEGDLPF